MNRGWIDTEVFKQFQNHFDKRKPEKKKTLVLDLDETLVKVSSFEPPHFHVKVTVAPHNSLLYITYRPHLMETLNALA